MTDDMMQASIDRQKSIKEAERLAKIEVLEEVLNDSRLCSENYDSIIREEIAILKAGN